ETRRSVERGGGTKTRQAHCHAYRAKSGLLSRRGLPPGLLQDQPRALRGLCTGQRPQGNAQENLEKIALKCHADDKAAFMAHAVIVAAIGTGCGAVHVIAVWRAAVIGAADSALRSKQKVLGRSSHV